MITSASAKVFRARAIRLASLLRERPLPSFIDPNLETADFAGFSGTSVRDLRRRKEAMFSLKTEFSPLK
jgi:hypothetical protein